MSASRISVIALLCVAFVLGMSTVFYLSRIQSLSEALRKKSQVEYIARFPLILEGRILAYDESSASILFENSGKWFARGATSSVWVRTDAQTRLLRRDAVREGEVIIGVSEKEVTSPAEIPPRSFSVLYIDIEDKEGSFYAREAVFGTFPR